MKRGATKTGQAKRGKKPAAKKRGRPSKYSPQIAKKIIEGLSKGTPLTILCSESNMPSDDTVRNWAKNDPVFSRDIARARETGFDQIAMDALRIADNVGHENKDTVETKFGEIPNKEWIQRSALRVETRLKLLAKWDPKRYGEKITQEITGADGGPVRTEGDFRPSPEDEAVIRRIAETRAKLTSEREGA